MDFYHNRTNSILQQLERNFWKITDVRVGFGVGGATVTSGRTLSHRIRVMGGCVIWVCLIDIWVDTWDRGFRCGVSDFCFIFKNAARATVR
jgi:hypothetical protein